MLRANRKSKVRERRMRRQGQHLANAMLAAFARGWAAEVEALNTGQPVPRGVYDVQGYDCHVVICRGSYGLSLLPVPHNRGLSD